jgi:hypothetical protein
MRPLNGVSVWCPSASGSREGTQCRGDGDVDANLAERDTREHKTLHHNVSGIMCM